LASLTHTSRAQGRKKKRTKRDSLLEEKGRADEELEDGHRHGPAFRYRGHPSKHTTNREHFFLSVTPNRTTHHLKCSYKCLKTINPNPRQTGLDPSMTHSNPMMVASVVENATTSTVARVEARVAKTEE